MSISPGDARVGKMLASSAAGATFLILIQLASRIFTFASNQVVLRTLSPAVLGVAAQLELYQVSILYFSRESIRMAIQRQPWAETSPYNSKNGPHQGAKEAETPSTAMQPTASQSVVNVSYLSLALGIPSSLFFTILYRHLVSTEASQTPFFFPSVMVTGAASLLELGIEPFFAVVQQHMLYEKRAAVEMPAAFIKSFTICFAFLYTSRLGYDVGALPFALGHFSYSLALICGYSMFMLGGTKEAPFSFLLTRIETSKPSDYIGGRFSRRLISLAASVFFQSLVKHLLTQGDSMILAAMSSLEDQGIYSLASNYGGLVARIIFQPLEESSRILFATLLSPDDSGKQNRVHVGTAKAHLLDISRAYQLLSMVVFPVGPVMVPQLLPILGGRQWTSTKVADLLSLYCFYIPFLAFNGITEAFVASAANSREIQKQTAWMGAFSACYAVAAYLFLEVGNLGAYGLVLANIVNMGVRTLWSYIFIRSYLERNGDGLRLREASIRPVSFISGATATVVFAGQGLLKPGCGFVNGLAFSSAYTLLVVYLEKESLMHLWARMHQMLFTRAKGNKAE